MKQNTRTTGTTYLAARDDDEMMRTRTGTRDISAAEALRRRERQERNAWTNDANTGKKGKRNPNARGNETCMAKNMPARDKMNSRRSKPPGNDEDPQAISRPAVETITREAGTSRRIHPLIAVRRRRRRPRPLIIAE